MKEYLNMLDEFLYYETIPDCHKESIKGLIAKIKSSNSEYLKCRKEIVALFEECVDIPDPFYIEDILKKYFGGKHG